MSIEAAVTAWLTADPDVQALASGRVYPEIIPQGASFPCVSYYRTGQETTKSLSGLSGLSKARLTLDCWALTYTDAKALALAIRGTKTTPKLDGYRGTIGGVKIQACFCENESDLIERPVHGDEKGVPHVALDFSFTFEDV